MPFLIALGLLFFLPIIESFNREVGYQILLVSALFIIFSLYHKKQIIFTWIENLWLIVLIFFAVSTIKSLSLSKSFLELLRYYAYFLIYLSIRNYKDKKILLHKFFLPMVLINSLILSFLSLLYLFPFFKLPTIENSMNLFYPSFAHNRISDLLIFTLPIVLFQPVLQVNKEKKYIYFFLSSFFMMIFFLAMGRGAILSLALSLIIVVFSFLIAKKDELLLIKKYKLVLNWTVTLSSLSVLFLLSSFIYSNLINDDFVRNNLLKNFYKPVFREQRLNYFYQAFDGILFSPLFGTGLGTFRYFSQRNGQNINQYSWFAHNHYLEIFQETGILGGIFFALFIFLSLFYAYKKISQLDNEKEKFLYIGLFTGVTASSLHSLLDYDWHFLSIFLIYLMCLAFLLPSFIFPQIKLTNTCFKLLLIFLFLSIIIKFIFPLDSDSILARAASLENSGAETLFILEKANRLDPLNINLIFRLGEEYELRNLYDQAHRLYTDQLYFFRENAKFLAQRDLFAYEKEMRQFLAKEDYQSLDKSINELSAKYPFFQNYLQQKIYQSKYRSSDEFYFSLYYEDYLNTLTKEALDLELIKRDADSIVQN